MRRSLHLLFFFCDVILFFLETQFPCAWECDEAYTARAVAWISLLTDYNSPQPPLHWGYFAQVYYKKKALLPCIPVLREDGYLLYIHIYFNRFRYTKELCDMKHTRRKSSMWCDTVVWLCLLTFFAPAPFVTTTLPSVVLFCSSLVAFTRLIHVVVRWPFSVFASLTCIVDAHSSEAGANPFLGRYNIATANVTTRTRSKKKEID